MKPYLLFLISIMISGISFAQFDILKKATKKVEEKIEKAIDKTDEEKKSGTEQKEAETVNESKELPVSEESPGTRKTEFATYTKFDFVPGDKIIFYDDFADDAVGDFPKRWNTNGSGEVVKSNNNAENWFKLLTGVSYMPYLNLENFGEDYTVEVDFLLNVPSNGNYGSLYFDFFSNTDPDEVPSSSSGPFQPGVKFTFSPRMGNAAHFIAIASYKEGNSLKNSSPNSTEVKGFIDNQVNRLSFAFNGQRFRVYINEKKVMDLPRLLKPDMNINKMNIRTWYWNNAQDYSILVKDVRIAQGVKDTRNQLLTEGKIVTRGILFDTGSDRIKPESYGTLKDISATLKENSSVKVKIIGHTDSDGSDESNLDLSKRRAAAVKSVLESEFNISSAQLDTDGKGETEPVSQNDNAEGKAHNRRVEFIKM